MTNPFRPKPRILIFSCPACDNEFGILDNGFIADGIKQQLYTGLAVCIHILQKGIAKSASGSGSFCI